MRTLTFSVAVVSLFAGAMFALGRTAASSARIAIDAGNQAWIDGIVAGDVNRIIETYSEEAVNCGPIGECIRGRLQIEREMATQLSSLGRARSAAVKTWGMTEQGSFVYEWGQAEATFDGGKRLVERYLTVWQRQPNGTWKIFRNMVIPDR